MVDSEERMLVKTDLNLNIEFKEFYQNLLKNIINALDEIKAYKYGFYDHCIQPIGMRRLDVLPMATMCIVCQQLIEKESNQ